MCCKFSIQRMKDFWDDINKSSAYSAFAWDYCYDAFRNPKIDKDTKCLYIESYLGSFGMKSRGIFGHHTNHTVHKPAIDFLLKKYKENGGELSIEKLRTKIKNRKPTDLHYFEYENISCNVCDMVEELREKYNPHREAIATINQVNKISSVTDTYLTKVMLATTGYTIGYDTYVKKALKECNDTSITITDGDKSDFHSMSLTGVYIFTCQNKEDIRACQKFMKTPSGQPYSIMRIVDIHFLLVGKEIANQQQ